MGCKSWGVRIWNFKISHPNLISGKPLARPEFSRIGPSCCLLTKAGPAFLSYACQPEFGSPPPCCTCVGESSAWGASPRRAHSLGLSAANAASSGIDAGALRRFDPAASRRGRGQCKSHQRRHCAGGSARCPAHHADCTHPASPSWALKAVACPCGASGLVRFVRLLPHSSGFSGAPGRWAGHRRPGDLALGGSWAGGGRAACPVRQRPE